MQQHWGRVLLYAFIIIGVIWVLTIWLAPVFFEWLLALVDSSGLGIVFHSIISFIAEHFWVLAVLATFGIHFQSGKGLVRKGI